MRKTQVALAALALVASTAVLADGVTVYGIVDASVASSNATSTAFAGTGNWLPSLMGFKGSEDLGNGMKANFNLEHGLSAGTGATSNGGMGTNMFNRNSNVGLSGDFGAITAGLQISPFIVGSLGGYVNDNMSFYVNSLALTTVSVASSGSTTAGGFFIPNAISYSLPTTAPISGTALMSLGAGTAQDEYKAATVGTSISAVALSGSYQSRGGAAGTAYKSYNINAATTLNGIRIAGGVTRHDVDGTTPSVNGMNIGASYALSDATNVALNYAKSSTSSSTYDKTLVNASLQHNLSKRTFIYATIGLGKNGAGVTYEGVAASPATGSRTGYALGLAHSF